ncbi:MAG TPA: aconitate hydratase AcnA [Paenalcaligenes sp.]|nr:aconitate hydratase AcnA [Paenalcaligenes sp.]
MSRIFDLKTLSFNGQDYLYAPIERFPEIDKLPYSLRIVLENLVRQQAHMGRDTAAQIQAVLDRKVGTAIDFYPSRVFGHDILGLVMLLDMVALREAVAESGGDVEQVRPHVPTDVVVDHSLQVDSWANPEAAAINLAIEYKRNAERFRFLRWCGNNFDGVNVIPPGKGIMHQLHLEHIGQVVMETTDDSGAYSAPILSPDSCVGTDSHTPMADGLGILAWGVGGIEAEAVMLGQPVTMPLPEVVGIELTGALPEGVLPTDLVLEITERLRNLGVVGKFVEFFGAGLDNLSLGDRGTIANMAPEYGATVVFFPVDQETLNYLYMTGRDEDHIAKVKAYCQQQKLWRDADSPAPQFETVLKVDLNEIRPSVSGPSQPEQRHDLAEAAPRFIKEHERIAGRPADLNKTYPVSGEDFELHDGAIVIAAITSCTNTANPTNMVAAGLLAKNAYAKGLTPKPWVKTSLVPGSQVTADILATSGLQDSLDHLGFHIAGFGCTTCNGGSGPLPPAIDACIHDNDLIATAVLSGNRNFDGRIHPSVRANYLASPALVIAYALAGSLTINIADDPLGYDDQGNAVYLKDIWPSAQEIQQTVQEAYARDLFIKRYAELFNGGPQWDALESKAGSHFDWDPQSHYIRKPPYFDGLDTAQPAVKNYRLLKPLVILGDSITTDHISPSGAISLGTPAADYLQERGVEQKDFNNYTTRRANHEIVMRATFANIRLRNKMVPGIEGGVTKLMPDGEVMRVYDAAQEYMRRQQPLVIIAGKNYGSGSSRDSAAKGVALLGVKVVLTESFERIHLSNLIGMGVLPLQFSPGVNAETLNLTGAETYDVSGLDEHIQPGQGLLLTIRYADGTSKETKVIARLDTDTDVEYWRHGGILPYTWRRYVQTGAS